MSPVLRDAERNAHGEPFIYAFALGLVNNYCKGLCMSTHAKVRVNLTKVITRYFRHNVPQSKYTTIQLNKNYATKKMHVDGNNEGPSYIVGVGDYTGGGGEERRAGAEGGGWEGQQRLLFL